MRKTSHHSHLAKAAKHMAKAHEHMHAASKKHIDAAADKKLIKSELAKKMKSKKK